MTHLEKTQETNSSVYLTVEYTDGTKGITERAKGLGKIVAWGAFEDYGRQTAGYAQVKYTSLKQFLRSNGRKISEVKRHNWDVID